jgi:hypothetical protein
MINKKYKKFWYQLGYSTEKEEICELFLCIMSILAGFGVTVRSRYWKEQLKKKYRKVIHHLTNYQYDEELKFTIEFIRTFLAMYKIVQEENEVEKMIITLTIFCKLKKSIKRKMIKLVQRKK